jgi:O-antigen/teichoic acid export membrane protein
MTVARNALWLSAARLMAKALAFGAGVAIARRLGAVAFGQYSLVIAFTLIFSSLADFGLVSLLIREVAAGNESPADLLGRAVRAQLYIAAGTVVVLLGVGFVAEVNDTTRYGLCLTAGGLFVESLGRPFSGVLIGSGKLIQSAATIAAVSLANTAMLLLVLAVHPAILTLLAVSIPAGVLAACLPAVLVWHLGVRPGWKADRRLVELLIRAFPFALLAGSAIIYDRVDIVILSHLAGNRAVGIYSAADRVVDGLLVLPASIGAALYPALAAAPAQALHRLRVTMAWAAPLALAVTLLSVVPGGYIADSIYGHDYPGVGGALQILSSLVVLGVGTVSLAYLLQAQMRTRLAIAATALGLVIDIGLNILLIPRFSFRGAAISASAAEAAVLLCLAYFCFGPRMKGKENKLEVQDE